MPDISMNDTQAAAVFEFLFLARAKNLIFEERRGVKVGTTKVIEKGNNYAIVTVKVEAFPHCMAVTLSNKASWRNRQKRWKKIDHILTEWVERNPSNTPVLNLEEYGRLALKDHPTCYCCGKPLQAGDLQHHDHDGGWKVAGFAERQWLYFDCTHPAPQYWRKDQLCKYQHSLVKLDIPR